MKSLAMMECSGNNIRMTKLLASACRMAACRMAAYRMAACRKARTTTTMASVSLGGTTAVGWWWHW